MAKSGKAFKQKFNYNGELKRLREQGPERLYLLYGPEEYLRDRFLEELEKRCVPSGDDFSLRRLAGAGLDLNELSQAVNAMPFFSERSLVLVRDYDLNKCREGEWDRLKIILADLPDWCTLAFIQSPTLNPDGRLAAVKGLKKLGYVMEFTEQEAGALTGWITNRCRALGKSISRNDAEYLIFLCGGMMQGLIPQIEKAAAHAVGEAVTRADIDATADRLPEADVFALTEELSRRRYDRAAAILADLLGNKDNHPIMLTALIGNQLRRMYACKVGQNAHRSRGDVMELCAVRYDSIYEKLAAAVKPYTEASLARLVSLCADYDCRMKSTGLDPGDLLRELFARVAAEV